MGKAVRRAVRIKDGKPISRSNISTEIILFQYFEKVINTIPDPQNLGVTLSGVWKRHRDRSRSPSAGVDQPNF